MSGIIEPTNKTNLLLSHFLCLTKQRAKTEIYSPPLSLHNHTNISDLNSSSTYTQLDISTIKRKPSLVITQFTPTRVTNFEYYY